MPKAQAMQMNRREVFTQAQKDEILKVYDEIGLDETSKRFGLPKTILRELRRERQKEWNKINGRMTPEGIARLRRSAIAYARKRKCESISEDFASFCVTKRLEGNEFKIKYMFASFLQETFGNLKTEAGRTKSKAIAFMESIHVIPADSPCEKSDLTLMEMVDFIKGTSLTDLERSAFLLHNIYDLTDAEISLVLNVGHTSACNIRNDAVSKLRSAI